MSAQSITLNMPTQMYERLQQRAQQAHRSVEDELLDMVATAVPTAESLSDDLAAAVAALALLDDDGLRRAARSHLPATAASRMEALHDKGQSEGLTTAEQETLATLVRQYERYMLVRARSAVLLQERGYDISTLLSTK